MKLTAIFAFVIGAASAFAAPLSLTTTGGKTYTDVVVTSSTPLTVTITHADGIATIHYAVLDEATKTQLCYNPETAAKAESDLAEKAKLVAKQKAEAKANYEKAEARSSAIRSQLAARASRALATASMEEQLIVASAAKFLADQKRAYFQLEDFQFMDQKSKAAIITYCPQYLPIELLPID